MAAQVYMRNFGWFQLQLWDDVLADLQPITENDTIMVNFGAWCAPRQRIPAYRSISGNAGLSQNTRNALCDLAAVVWGMQRTVACSAQAALVNEP